MTRLLSIGCALLAVATIGLGYMLKAAWGANGALKTKLSAANAVIQQREQDAAQNAKAVAQLAEKLATTETKVITQVERIYAAPRTTACVEQPSIRAALGGLSDIYARPLPAADRRQLEVALPAAGPVARPAIR